MKVLSLIQVTGCWSQRGTKTKDIAVYSFLLFCRPGVPLCVESNEVVGNEAAARVHDVAVGLLLPRHEGGGRLLRVDCGDI